MNSAVSETSIYEQHPYFFKESEIYYPDSDGEPMAETDVHRDLIIALIESLKLFFKDRADVYVTGNIMFYYMEGAPHEVVSPDVMVCFGVPKGDRRYYQSWNEDDVMPSIVFEIASRKTWSKDRNEKRALYEVIGVQEYYIFNPEYPKRLPALIAHKSQKGLLQTANTEDDRIFSEVLGLEIVDTGKTLRLLNPQTKDFLPTREELAEKASERNLLADENARLKAELERLKKLLKNSD